MRVSATGGGELGADELAELVVYYEPAVRAAAPAPVTAQVETLNKRFAPATLVLPVGSTVAFPNRDAVLHNAFSISPGAAFDLGIYGPGEKREQRFGAKGIVRVHCNVHHSMQADIVFVDTPYFTKADGQGRFAFTDVPPGKGTLFFWHPRASLQSSPVQVPGAALSLRLEASKPRIEPHSRKDGQSYRGDAAP